jgi:hypothetical protein
MVNAALVNGGRSEFLPAAKTVISRVLTRKSAIQKIR